MWLQLGMMAYNAWQNRKANKQNEELEHQRRLELEKNRQIAEQEKKFYDANVRPVGQRMVSEGLGQGRSRAYGYAASVAANRDAETRRRINSNTGTPMGLVANQNLGMDLATAQRNAGLVMQDEVHKQQEAQQGAELLGRTPGYVGLMTNANTTMANLDEDQANRARGQSEQYAQGISDMLGSLGRESYNQPEKPTTPADPAAKASPVANPNTQYRGISAIENKVGGYFGQLGQGLRNIYRGWRYSSNSSPMMD